MSNALKYTSDGYIHIAGRLLRRGDDTLLRIYVVDSGCGISRELQHKLFNLFSNVKLKNNINQHGIGLGLTMCKKIVEALKGKLVCKSRVGEGTQFKVDLPI